MNGLEIVSNFRTPSNSDIWEILKCSGVLSTEIPFELYGEELKLENVEKRLKPNDPFFCKHGEIEISFSHIRNHDLSFLTIENVEIKDETIIESFYQTDGFVEARTYDCNYNHWQNVNSISTYELAGKPYDHLPKIDNGFSPPMNEIILDTRQNPGVRILRSGYVEFIGSSMWFNQEWLNRKKLNFEVFDHIVLNDRVVKITLSNTAFNSDQGTQGEIQKRFRNLFWEKIQNQTEHFS